MSVSEFDYTAPAELFGGGKWNGRPAAITYKRFDAAAQAIQYAVEQLSGAGARVCVLEVNEERFDHRGIRELYDRSDYPLTRTSVADSEPA